MVRKVELSAELMVCVSFLAPTQEVPLKTAISSFAESGRSSRIAEATLIFIRFKPDCPFQTVTKWVGAIPPPFIIRTSTIRLVVTILSVSYTHLRAHETDSY